MSLCLSTTNYCDKLLQRQSGNLIKRIKSNQSDVNPNLKVFVPERNHWSLFPILPPPPTPIFPAHCQETSKDPPMAAQILPASNFCHQQLRPRHRRRPLLPRHHLHLLQLQHQHPQPSLVQRLHPPAPPLLLPLPLLCCRAQQ